MNSKLVCERCGHTDAEHRNITHGFYDGCQMCGCGGMTPKQTITTLQELTGCDVREEHGVWWIGDICRPSWREAYEAWLDVEAGRYEWRRTHGIPE